MRAMSALLSGVLLFSVLAGAAEQKISEKTCIDTGRTTTLGEAGASVQLSRDGKRVIVLPYDQTTFRVTSL